jgi:hypothetical protein
VGFLGISIFSLCFEIGENQHHPRATIYGEEKVDAAAISIVRWIEADR